MVQTTAQAASVAEASVDISSRRSTLYNCATCTKFINSVKYQKQPVSKTRLFLSRRLGNGCLNDCFSVSLMRRSSCQQWCHSLFAHFSPNICLLVYTRYRRLHVVFIHLGRPPAAIRTHVQGITNSRRHSASIESATCTPRSKMLGTHTDRRRDLDR